MSDAIEILVDLPDDIKFSAGVLSTLVTLYLAAEKRPYAAQLLKQAVCGMKEGKMTNKSTDMSIIWRKTAEFHLKGDEPAVASQSLEELLKVDPSNVQTLAQLVLAYAKYDLKKALGASKQLPKFSEQSKIDVDVLESSSFVSAKYGKKTPKPGDPITPKIPSGNNRMLNLKYHQTCSLISLYYFRPVIASTYSCLFNLQKVQLTWKKQQKRSVSASTRKDCPKHMILMLILIQKDGFREESELVTEELGKSAGRAKSSQAHREHRQVNKKLLTILKRKPPRKEQ